MRQHTALSFFEKVVCYNNAMIPRSKGRKPHELAHKWLYDLGTCPQYEHKSGIVIPRYANSGQNCESAQHGTIRGYHY